MGVHDLWSILGPVRESVPLYSLTGKTLAVDLSLWVCEAQHVQAMMGRVTKPHLRNLFFRVSSLTLMGVKLVFVMEGEAPKIKAETMSKRTEMRFGGFKKSAPRATTSKRPNRGRFNAVLKECAEMLDCLGVPWVTAAGEAEAMCAYLDSQGLVDGCITNDGDVFLYGAQTVYRNFNMNTKDPQVDCYRTSRVQTELNLSRENLVGLAILLGCDYIPKGIPGVGREHALRLIQILKGQTLLQRFSQWREEGAHIPERAVKKVPHCHICRHPGSVKAHERGGCLLCDSKRFCEPQDFDYQCPCDWHSSEQTQQASSAEANIRRKTLMSEQFPFTEIINEFLITKDKPVQHFRRRKPNMLSMQNFAYNKMDWPKHYTSEKVLVLMTYTELINRKHGRDTSSQIKPLRILKPRVRNTVACFEVIWSTPEHYVFPEELKQDDVRTVEEEALFRLAFPEVVELYLRDKALAEENKTKKKKTKSKKEKPWDLCDGVSELLAQMTLQSSTAATGDTQTPPPPPTVTNTDKPEVVVLDTPPPVAPKQHLYQREDHPGLEACPAAQVKEVASPLCLPRRESVTVASPSVSSVIDALHLSDIDWEAVSFTSSPPPQAATARTTEPRTAPTADTDTKQEISADLRPALEPCYADCSLRERVLMSNMLKSMNQREARNDEVTKDLLYTSSPLGPTGVSSRSQDSKRSGLIPIKGSTDVSLSGKPQVVDKKAPLGGKDQSVTTKVDQDYRASTQNVVPLAQTQGKTKDNGNGNQKPLQKYTFVKSATCSSSAPSQRSHSDPGQGDKDRKLHQTTKKSVCASACSSSEDSDAENQRVGARRARNKPKSKPKASHRTDFSLKPTNRVTNTKVTLNSGCSSQSLKPKVLSNRVGDQINASSTSTKGKCGSASTKGKCQDVAPVRVEDDVFLVIPASPVTVSDSDNSAVGDDSPLPLAERLRLRFLK